MNIHEHKQPIHVYAYGKRTIKYNTL